ncbi:MAG: PQQ-like beta-propeller repeat protein [Deltaproteobacteria bacterium]|nr:PQQ-like beta-propeller repeat protein [Deltaproteobacteria bacterium]
MRWSRLVIATAVMSAGACNKDKPAEAVDDSPAARRKRDCDRFALDMAQTVAFTGQALVTALDDDPAGAEADRSRASMRDEARTLRKSLFDKCMAWPQEVMECLPPLGGLKDGCDERLIAAMEGATAPPKTLPPGPSPAWTLDLDEAPRALAVHADGTAVVVGGSTTEAVLGIRDGTQVWRTEDRAAPWLLPLSSEPATWVAAFGSRLVAFDPRTGTERWVAQLPPLPPVDDGWDDEDEPGAEELDVERGEPSPAIMVAALHGQSVIVGDAEARFFEVRPQACASSSPRAVADGKTPANADGKTETNAKTTADGKTGSGSRAQGKTGSRSAAAEKAASGSTASGKIDGAPTGACVVAAGRLDDEVLEDDARLLFDDNGKRYLWESDTLRAFAEDWRPLMVARAHDSFDAVAVSRGSLVLTIDDDLVVLDPTQCRGARPFGPSAWPQPRVMTFEGSDDCEECVRPPPGCRRWRTYIESAEGQAVLDDGTVVLHGDGYTYAMADERTRWKMVTSGSGPVLTDGTRVFGWSSGVREDEPPGLFELSPTDGSFRWYSPLPFAMELVYYGDDVEFAHGPGWLATSYETTLLAVPVPPA